MQRVGTHKKARALRCTSWCERAPLWLCSALVTDSDHILPQLHSVEGKFEKHFQSNNQWRHRVRVSKECQNLFLYGKSALRGLHPSGYCQADGKVLGDSEFCLPTIRSQTCLGKWYGTSLEYR